MLYTDDEEARFRDRRPFILNGIPDFVTRGDLADRSIKIVLAPILPENRREESALHAEFESLLPGLLGALYDAVACALANIDKVVLPNPPRMADAAKWITAAESALGWKPGTFVDAHERAMGEAASAVVEGDPVALAIRNLAYEGTWQHFGRRTAREARPPENEKAAKEKDWPRSPQGMASAMRRCAPELRAVGVDMVQDEEADRERRTRLWTITRRSPEEDAKEDQDPPSDRISTPGPDTTTTCPRCGVEASDGHECEEETS